MTSVAARAFRDCVGEFATGVTVVTAESEHGPAGMTLNSFTSVSLDPPLVLWCPAKSASGTPAFTAAKHFAVNVLGSAHLDICRNFASKAEDKFAGVQWREGGLGQPVLDQVAIAWAECEVEQVVEAGDHYIFIGAFRDGAVAEAAADPIVHYQRSFGRWNEIEE